MRKSLLGLAIGALAFVSTPSSDAAEILLVSDNAFAGAPTEARTGDPEAPFVSFLESLGHTVTRATGSGGTTQFREANGGFAAAQAAGADLIIVSRVTSSDQYDAAAQITGWNGITTPLLLMGPHLARNNRWKWVNTAANPDETAVTDLELVNSSHPFVAGRSTSLLDAGTNRTITRSDVAPVGGMVGNGSVIATLGGDAAIIEWEPGELFYEGAGQTAAGRRVLFPGLRYHESIDIDGDLTGAGDPVEFEDFSDNGKAILAQTINNLVVPEPGTLSVLAIGAATLLRRRRA